MYYMYNKTKYRKRPRNNNKTTQQNSDASTAPSRIDKNLVAVVVHFFTVDDPRRPKYIDISW